MIWLAVALWAALVAWIVWQHLTRRRPAPRLSNDWCRVCRKDLPVGKVWEVRTNPEMAEDGVGGTWMVHTYCRRHKPKDAIRA